MKSQGFPRENRIRKRGNFLRVQREGRKIVTRIFVFLTRPNEEQRPRLGLTVSKKVGNAVVRNRVKRVVREAFRRSHPFEGMGLDLVVIPRAALPKPARYSDVLRDFEILERKYREHGRQADERRRAR